MQFGYCNLCEINNLMFENILDYETKEKGGFIWEGKNFCQKQ